MNENCQIEIFNQSAESMFGYTAAEILGQPLDILFPNALRHLYQQHIRDFALSGHIVSQLGEQRGILGRRHNGEEFSAEASISRLRRRNETVFTVMMKDITERKKNAKALQLAYEELENRVEQRTAQLQQTNERLRREVRERMPVKLYIPEETEAIHIFEQRVLKSDEDIALFRQLRQTRIVQLRTFDTLRAVIRDFEDRNVGAIAFGTLSKVFGQCSVYPLALIESGRNVVQPLIQANGKPIDPATDLCKDKGSYVPDVQVFQTGRYPLGYPLAVIYPRDNSLPPAGQKFAEILRTLQAQRLLNETGLVPLEPLPED